MRLCKGRAGEAFVTAGWGGALLVVALALNLGSNVLVALFNGLLFLDMLGTAMLALAMGPWWAALVGLCTNLVLGAARGHVEYPNFAMVNVYGGVLWGAVVHCRHRRLRWLSWLAPFSAIGWRLLVKILLLGLLGGFVCSFIATYTRTDFQSVVTPPVIAKLTEAHAAERLMSTAVACHYLGLKVGDPTYKFLFVDFFTIIPDKIISVAFAAFGLYFFFPGFSTGAKPGKPPATGRGSARLLATRRGSALAFLVGAVLALVLGRSLWDSHPFNPWKAAVWWLPVIFAAVAAVRPDRVYTVDVSGSLRQERLTMDDCYRDVLGLVGLWYSILLAFLLPPAPAAKPPEAAPQHQQATMPQAQAGNATSSASSTLKCQDATSPGVLARDGIGIFGFLTVFGFVPLTVNKYLRSSPDQAVQRAAHRRSAPE